MQNVAAIPRTMPYQGRPVVAKRWTDRLGENTLILTQTGKLRGRSCPPGQGPCSDAEVYAYHYVRRGAAVSLLWRTADFERGCEFDLYAGFIPESVAITDLDADGVAESSFMYLLACRSDVSPATLKLIMHEGAQKYAARGSSRPRGAGMGGEMRPDAALTSAPRTFGEFVGAQWRRFRGHDTFQQF
ncbi:MAG TPA: hypothetical protein VK420_21970 [Longimicrobium sp.]|nr:hypothetical protein [Longimicrobium sp.]